MSRFLLVDTANQFAINSFVSVPDISLKISAAITLTLRNISEVTKKYDCTRVVFCMEGGSWRRDVYPEYKAHRRIKNSEASKKEKEEQEFFFSETDRFMNAVKTKTNAIVLRENKIEGDDFIARWIQTHPNDEHIILSNDSDFYQLISNNVRIYNPQHNYIISIDSVLDIEGNPAFKEKTITEKKSNITIKKKKSYPIETPNPEYELFKKIIRGDAGDNISSAYPRASEKGTKNKTGILEAFVDRKNKSYHWNSFMLHEWKKVKSLDEDGTPITENVKVKDEFCINEQLIDLTKQPDNIKDIMDLAINLEEEKPVKRNIGLLLNGILTDLDLLTVLKNPQFYISPLAKV